MHTFRSLPTFLKALLISALCSSGPAVAQPDAGNMRFTLVDMCPYSREFLCLTTMILARGQIAPSTGREFSSFLRTNATLLRKEQVRHVVFDSPGGSLFGEMELGRAIRDTGLETVLKSHIGGRLTQGGGGKVALDGASCASACSLAFLGGSKRHSVYWSGKIGVHQFSSPAEQIGDSGTQVTVTMIARYVDEMGVNRGFLDIASITSPHKIHWLTDEQQYRLGVDNTQSTKAEWKLSARSDGTTVAEIQQSFPATGASCRAEVYSARGQAVLRWTFRSAGGIAYAKHARDSFSDRSITLTLDSENPLGDLPGTLWQVTSDGALEALIRLPPHVVQKLPRSKKIAVSVLTSMADSYLDPSCEFETGAAANLFRAATK